MSKVSSVTLFSDTYDYTLTYQQVLVITYCLIKRTDNASIINLYSWVFCSCTWGGQYSFFREEFISVLEPGQTILDMYMYVFESNQFEFQTGYSM